MDKNAADKSSKSGSGSTGSAGNLASINSKIDADLKEHFEPVNIPEDYLCPITQELMEDPVIALDGHSYSRDALIEWFKRGNRTSPFTGEKLKDTVFIPNHRLKSIILEFKSKLPAFQRERQIQVDLGMAIQLREDNIVQLLNKQNLKEAALKAEQAKSAALNKELLSLQQSMQAIRLSANHSAAAEAVGAAASPPFQPITPLKLMGAASAAASAEKIIKLDEKRAAELYQLAANQRLADAQYKLGLCYQYGQGVAKDETRAVEYFQLAANQNHVNALAILKKSHVNRTLIK